MSDDADRVPDSVSEMEREEKERVSRVDDILRRRELAFLEEERVLQVWEAPAWVYKPRTREYFTTIGAILVLVGIILLFIREWVLLAVLVAAAFVAYTFATVKPEKTKHEISTRGVRTGGKFYRWDSLGRYWFEMQNGQQVVNIETLLNFPHRLILILPEEKEELFKNLLSPYVLLEKPEPGFVDKASTWLSDKVPLEGA